MTEINYSEGMEILERTHASYINNYIFSPFTIIDNVIY